MAANNQYDNTQYDDTQYDDTQYDDNQYEYDNNNEYNEYDEYYDDDNKDNNNDNNNNNDGNNEIIDCSTSFMDSSMYYFPSTSSMERLSNLDFGIICQPLGSSSSSSSIKEDENNNNENEEIPLINFNVNTETENSSVIRCRSCRAYINPYVEWISNGIHTHWICNLCGVSNELHSKSYYENYLKNKCLELLHGSVEIVAPDEYCVRPPQFPSYLFVINVNKQLIESNILKNICQTLKQIINNDNDNYSNFNITKQTQIGFITYCDKIHYYSLKSNLTKPKMIVINDINDALLPIPANQVCFISVIII